MNNFKSFQIIVYIVLIMLFLNACGVPATIPATTTLISPTPTPIPPTLTPMPLYIEEKVKIEGVGKIKYVYNSEGNVEFIDEEGIHFEKGVSIPIILFETTSDGNLANLGVLVSSPFAQINPAILNLVDISPGPYNMIGVQSATNGPVMGVFIDSTSYKYFYIDPELIVYPIKNEDFYLKSIKNSPFVSISIVGENKKVIDLRHLAIRLETKSGIILYTEIQENGSLLVTNVPSETLKLITPAWTFELFPSFRGAIPEIVNYRIFNVPLTDN
jgi:hypothetical protein